MDMVLLEEAPVRELQIKVRDNLSLVPAGTRLHEIEHIKEGGSNRGMILKTAIKKLRSEDFILVDCPPSAGLLTMNALLASKELLIPVSGDYLALHGLSRLMGLLKHIEERLKHKTKKWVVVTRFHERRRLAREVRDTVLQYFPGQVLATPIRETVALAESPSFGKTIFDYQRKGNGAQDYLSLADDLLKGRTFM
jgi:chromosome partitioning protein